MRSLLSTTASFRTTIQHRRTRRGTGRGHGDWAGTRPSPYPLKNCRCRARLLFLPSFGERTTIFIGKWLVSRSFAPTILSEHGLVITVLFGSSLDQNPVLPAVFLELLTPLKWLESAWNAWKTHFRQSIFQNFLFSGGGPQNPPFTPYAYAMQAWTAVEEPIYATVIIIRLHWSWFRGTAVERRSLAGELSLSCARPVAGRWPLMWVNRPL